MQKQVKKWLIFSILVAFIPFSLEAQAKPKSDWLSRFDFHIGFSVDLAFSQTPLHYLSYLPAEEMAKLPTDLKAYFENSRKTVSSGIGYGGIFGAGYRLKPNGPISLGLEYQLSSAGSEAKQSLYLNASYLDHRVRGYVKLTPTIHRKLAFSMSLFMGMAMIQLQDLVVRSDTYDVYKLTNLKYADGSRIFQQNPYIGFDIGFRASLYMLDAAFDLAITPLFTIPRFTVGISFNHETLKLINRK